jgi:hypothetical protein
MKGNEWSPQSEILRGGYKRQNQLELRDKNS